MRQERVTCPVCGRYVAIFASGSLSKHNFGPGGKTQCPASYKTYSWVRKEEAEKRASLGLLPERTLATEPTALSGIGEGV